MKTRIKSDKIITENGIFDGYLYFENGKITEISESAYKADHEYDYSGCYVSPGFIDFHLHGALDHDFSSCTIDEAISAINYHAAHGTTCLLPTVTSCSFNTTKSALGVLGKIVNSDKCFPTVVGVHLEGPYFNPKMGGAQNPKLITPPKSEEYRQLIREFGGIIKCWSYAPETDKNGEFCKYVTSHNIIASAGHSDADYNDMIIAEKSGCKMITHMFCRTSTVRNIGCEKVIGINESAFLSDSLVAEIIADGHHVPPELINMACKIMGYDRICLVTDALKATGTSAKTSSVGSVCCIIDDGVCKLPDKSALAGSIATTDRLVRVCVKKCGISVENAVKMASRTPSRVLGINKGVLKPDFDADIAIFDDDINIKSVFCGGKKI